MTAARPLITLASALVTAASGALCLACGGHGISARVLSSDAQPVARVTRIDVTSFTARHLSLVLSMELENPGDGLSLGSASYELFVEGTSLGRGTMAYPGEVAARANTPCELHISLSYHALPGRLRTKLLQGEALQVAIRGELSPTAPTLSHRALSFAGELMAVGTSP